MNYYSIKVLSFFADRPGEVQGLKFDPSNLYVNWNDLRGDFVISRYEVQFIPVNGSSLIMNTTDARVKIPIDILEIGVNYTVVVVAFDYADRDGDVSKPLVFILDGELDCFQSCFFPPL